MRTTARNCLPPALTATSLGVVPSLSAVTPVMEISSSPDKPSADEDSPVLYWSGRTPLPTRFDRLVRSQHSAITARTPRSAVPFAAQSREEPEPYSLPARITSGTPAAP